MSAETLPETPEEIEEILRELGLGSDGPPSPQYHSEYHYLDAPFNHRWMDFDTHYEEVSYRAQKQEVLNNRRMPDPDPNARVDHVNFGDVFAYGENGWGGDDPLSGSDAADTLRGGQGDDFLYGGNGADFLYGDEDNDVVDGGRGNDGIFGGTGTDVLYGGLGNDTIRGGEGDDDIGGGFGDDMIYGGGGHDNLYGDAGADTIYGGDGNDRLRGGDSIGGVRSDVLYGGDGDDIIRAGSGGNKIYGGKGNDDLGGAGTFYFETGDGRDILTGERSGLAGDQKISFEEDPNIAGFDDLTIEKFDGDVHPGTNDHGGWRVWYSATDYIDLIYLPSSSPPTRPTADNFVFAEEGVAPVVEPQESEAVPSGTEPGEQDRLPLESDITLHQSSSQSGSVSGGTEAAETLEGTSGADTINGRGGDDTVRGLGGDDRLWGRMGKDILHGNAGDDWLWGGRGADTLYGGKGNDTLRGGTEGDELNGGRGADTLHGGRGKDILSGGHGRDVFVYDDADFGRDRIVDFEDGKDLLKFTGSGLQWSDLSVSNNGKGHAVVRVEGADSRIVLEGVDASLIGQDDFIF